MQNTGAFSCGDGGRITMKRCSRCILPDAYPDMSFDEKGICDRCYEYDKKFLHRDYKKLERKLFGIVNWAKSQNKRYDCIVPFSGGKDSSYTIYICRKKFNLKVLAVNFNNGLRTFEALKNIEKITQKLDAGFICYGPNWGLLKKLYREFLLKAGKFCFVCDMGIWATVHRIAEQYDVPLIVSGFSAQIESLDNKMYSYNNNLFKNIAGDLLTKEEMKDFLEETKIQRLLKRLKHCRLTRYRKQISLPDYMVWDDKEIKRVITDELGWEKRQDGSSDHIDCLFAPIKNYLIVQKWGFGEKTTKYAAMTRAGELKREEALKKAQEEESKDVSGTLNKFKELLELSQKDIEEAKNKNHLIYL